MPHTCTQTSVYSCSALQIVSTQVCNAVRTLCNSVAATEGPSSLVATIKNAGTQPASLTATLGSCTHSNVTVPSQPLSLAPNQTSEAVFEVQYPVPVRKFRIRAQGTSAGTVHVGKVLCVDVFLCVVVPMYFHTAMFSMCPSFMVSTGVCIGHLPHI